MPKLPVGIYADTRRRITCVGCGLVAFGASDKLCQVCAEDTVALKKHCKSVLVDLRVGLTCDWKVLEQAIPDDLTSPLYARWCAYQQAIADNTDADKMAVASIEALARAGRLDPLLDLIRLWLAYTDAKAVYQEREQWAARVYQAIGELEQAKQPRKNEYVVTLGETRRKSACRSCGADICWKKTISGAQVPLSLATLIDRDGELFALSHFTDCPQGNAWSKA
jgi:hypothetical protein